tara:strand:- start:824 stop:1990 length:1167 start_codon:yes stop_codon:yes gene_type:complete
MKKNKICLIMKNNSNWTGGSEYIKNILLSFSFLEKNERDKIEVYLISFESSLENDYLFLKNSDYYYSLRDFRNSFIRRFLFFINEKNKLIQFVYIAFILYSKKVNFAYPFPDYLKWIGLKSALWIPDFQHHYLRDFFSKDDIKKRNKKFRKIIDSTSKIVLSSEDSKRDLIKFYDINNKKIYVLNFRTNLNKDWLLENPIEISNKYNLPDKFFLVSNQFWKHKNHLLVLDALNYLNIKKNININIIMTGRLNKEKEFSKKIIDKIKEYKLKNQLFILGLIPKKDQFLLMRRSIAVIQPSLFEGWSTILEETRSIGKNIILSDLEVHKEQNYRNSIFFIKNSYLDLADKIEQTFYKIECGPNLLDEKKFSEENSSLMKNFAKRFISLTN